MLNRYYFFYCCSSTVVSISSRHGPPTPPILASPLWTFSFWLCPCILYTGSLMALPRFSPIIPLPSSLWLLSVCSLFQCLWLYFACLFLLLIRSFISLLKLNEWMNKQWQCIRKCQTLSFLKAKTESPSPSLCYLGFLGWVANDDHIPLDILYAAIYVRRSKWEWKFRRETRT